MVNSSIKYLNHTINFYSLLTTGHNIDKFVLNNSLYARPDHNFSEILRHVSKNSIVYDIGAYIGSFAIPMALEGMKVFAFEGFPDNLSRLEKNCEPYDISCHGVALSNKSETVVTKFNSCRNQPDNPEVTVQYVILDEYVSSNNLPNPDFVKVDIEGMETLALLGMTHLIKNVKPVWQICYHLGIDEDLGDYPGFVPVNEGGFNFDTLFEDYRIFLHGFEVSKFDRFGEYLLIPK